MLKNIQVKAPHWINILALAGSGSFAALAANSDPSLAKWHALFIVLATVLGGITSANIQSSPEGGG